MNHPRKANMLTATEARAQLLAGAQRITGTELVPTADALGRVLAKPQISTINVPPLDNSAMDGYAVSLTDFGGSAPFRLRVTQRIPAGQTGSPLAAGTAARIFTGAPIPAGCDAVVMQEDCALDGETVIVKQHPKAGQNIRRAGEDIAAGAEVLRAGILLHPQEMGLAASVGLDQLPVFRKLRVATFFTGDEIVMPGHPLKPGQIYNSNRFVLTGLLQRLGCDIVDLGIVPDNLEMTIRVLREAASKADLVITSGGVSVGEEDHVKAAVETVGKLDLWRIAIKPGKPLAFGNASGIPFIGLPGNPVSAFVTFCMFVRPFILASQGVTETNPLALTLRADFNWPHPDKRREFLRARLAFAEDGETIVQIFPNQGSGVLTSTVWADGLAEIPENTTVQKGEPVRFIPFSSLFD